MMSHLAVLVSLAAADVPAAVPADAQFLPGRTRVVVRAPVFGGGGVVVRGRGFGLRAGPVIVPAATGFFPARGLGVPVGGFQAAPVLIQRRGILGPRFRVGAALVPVGGVTGVSAGLAVSAGTVGGYAGVAPAANVFQTHHVQRTVAVQQAPVVYQTMYAPPPVVQTQTVQRTVVVQQQQGLADVQCPTVTGGAPAAAPIGSAYDPGCTTVASPRATITIH